MIGLAFGVATRRDGSVGETEAGDQVRCYHSLLWMVARTLLASGAGEEGIEPIMRRQVELIDLVAAAWVGRGEEAELTFISCH